MSQIVYGAVFNHVMQSWWVILFVLIAAIVYERALNSQVENYHQLQLRLKELEEEKRLTLIKNERLLQQINSQSDYEWIEITLIKGLGLVPEEQTKVFFSKLTQNKTITQN